MKCIWMLLAVLLAGRNLQAQQHTAPRATQLDSVLADFYHRPDRVMVAAHRAAHLQYPENSLAAIEEAIRLGIDIVEFDVQCSKDSVLVVMHDKTITRTTGQKGKVKDYTFSELQQFHLLHNGKPTDQKILSFEQVLQATRGRIMIDIDFKEDDIAAAQKACAMIHAMGMEKQTLFFLYEYKYATLIGQWNTNQPVMPRAHSVDETHAILAMGHFPVIHGDEAFYSDTLMEAVHKAGTRVWLNTLGKYDDLEQAGSGTGFDKFFRQYRYANAVQTNYPYELLLYLQKRGLHR